MIVLTVFESKMRKDRPASYDRLGERILFTLSLTYLGGDADGDVVEEPEVGGAEHVEVPHTVPDLKIEHKMRWLSLRLARPLLISSPVRKYCH